MEQTPPIYEIINTLKSPVVLSWPHNGYHIPNAFRRDNKPLGLEKFWFDPGHQNRRHEACDWGMKDLLSEFLNLDQTLCHVDTNISRLIVDLNRIETHAFPVKSSETEHSIPGNQGLTPQQMSVRIKNYYSPYFKALEKTLKATKDAFGHIIWLDMHSFTPTWNGQLRSVKIGSLVMDKNKNTSRIETTFKDIFKDIYQTDQPYDLSKEPFRSINAGGAIAKKLNIDYFGVEIRNDLLSSSHDCQIMAKKFLSIIEQL